MKTNLKTSGLTLRLVPLTMAFMVAFSVLFAQPLHATSFINTIKCNSIKLFASASIGTMHSSQQFLQNTFQLELNLMQNGWKLEDVAVTSLRQVGESAFVGTLNAFSNRPGVFIKKTEVRAAALKEYKTNMLNALHTWETNIDAYRASYREDMLALVKAHQKALTDMVATLVETITAALDVAKAHCSDPHAVATLTGAIASANAKLFSNAWAQEVTDFTKAGKLVHTRNTGFHQENSKFFKISLNETGKLAKAFLTRK